MRLLLVTLLAFGSAKAEPIACPAYSSSNVRLENVPSGWRGSVNATLEPHYAAIYEGEPSQQGELAPTSHKGQIVTYTLDRGKRHWLMCLYGYAGDIRLSKPLPVGVSECVVRLQRDVVPQYSYVEGVSCK